MPEHDAAPLSDLLVSKATDSLHVSASKIRSPFIAQEHVLFLVLNCCQEVPYDLVVLIATIVNGQTIRMEVLDEFLVLVYLNNVFVRKIALRKLCLDEVVADNHINLRLVSAGSLFLDQCLEAEGWIDWLETENVGNTFP